MSVTHKSSIQNYLEALRVGGTHGFAISVDEIPELVSAAELERGTVPLRTIEEHGSVWSSIAREIHARGGRCFYRKMSGGGYDVTVEFPKPSELETSQNLATGHSVPLRS
jgi:hypothetical protein